MLDVLDRKIRQMHAALAGLSSEDLSGNRPQITFADGYVHTWVDFNQNSDAISLANAASLLIANIASIKDHLRAWCRKQNVTFDGEKLVDSNRAVALVHDLWNIDKHADLDRPPRSGHRPRLIGLRTALNLSTGTAAGAAAAFSMDPRTGMITTAVSGGGSVQLRLVAQVVDENGTMVGSFTEICAEAADAWCQTLRAAGVPFCQ